MSSEKNVENLEVFDIEGNPVSQPMPIPICSCHNKDEWMKCETYKQSTGSSITCRLCPWGTLLPGYMRLIDGRVRDLRNATS